MSHGLCQLISEKKQNSSTELKSEFTNRKRQNTQRKTADCIEDVLVFKLAGTNVTSLVSEFVFSLPTLCDTHN